MIYYCHGFNHSDVYNMPTYLRNFYIKLLIDVKSEENKNAKKANKKSDGSIHRAGIPQR